jgi:TetR/AcrR family transcriptional regulator, repressor of fatR-cypB operon
MPVKKASKKAVVAKVKNSEPDPRLVRLFANEAAKADLRRAAIIQVAIRIISEEGLERLSFDRIGKSVGIAKSHVVYYFDQKEAILAKCVEYSTIVGQSFVVPALSAAAPGARRLRAYIEGNFEWIKTHPEQAKVFILFIANCSRSPELAELYRQIRETSILRIKAILEEMAWKDSPKRDRTALAILDLITGSIIALMALNPKDFAKAWSKHLESAAQACGDLAAKAGP